MEEQNTPEPTTTPAETAAPEGDVPQEARTQAMLCHISALSGLIIPFGSIIGPLIFWLLNKDKMPFVDEQGKEALNFQITMFIAAVISAILIVVVIGFLLILAVAVISIVFSIIAALKANSGEHYRYPLSIRLLK